MIHRSDDGRIMARAYSQDLRDRLIDAALSGPSLRQAAARFDIAVSTAIGWMGRLRDSGERAARRQGRPRGLKLDPHRDFLLPLIEAEPDMTIETMQERLGDERGVKVNATSIPQDWCSSRRHARPPTWRRCMGGRPRESACAPAFRTATGNERPSSRGCDCRG